MSAYYIILVTLSFISLLIITILLGVEIYRESQQEKEAASKLEDNIEDKGESD